ncbi:B3/4 domain-containing protein [Streptomyces sp. YIM 98790]|uniref:B3/B4 domain-containing protein n=1 Tax=Streptomyces sp. YIM 98790 TaxID=2689077 RepID=UPI001A9DCAD8|nr:phenylalanine--tRNA ligase beta subunit-related protein [Streptomyces sp. YIM 98790]
MTQTTQTTQATQKAQGAREALTFTVHDSVFARVPEYVMGLLGVEEITVGSGDPEIARLLAGAEDEVLALRLGSRSGVAALPRIREWREAHRAVGFTPGRYPCAAESLLRRLAKGERLPRINDLVDLCNALSLGSRLPVACCDVADIGSFRLAPATGGETFLPLGRPDAPEPPEPGELVFLDERRRAHSRRWNWRQSDVVATATGRRRLMVTVESAHPDGRRDVEAVLERLAGLLARRTGAPPHTVVLDGARRSGTVLPAGNPGPGPGSGPDPGPGSASGTERGRDPGEATASWTRFSGRVW